MIKYLLCYIMTQVVISCIDLAPAHLMVALFIFSVFVKPDHFLHYTVMPYGLWNAAANVLRLMNRVLSGVSSCKVYSNNIVVYSSTWSEHMDTLQEFFTRLESACLTLNRVKCESDKAVVNCLGKQVGQEQVCHLVQENPKWLEPWLSVSGYVWLLSCFLQVGLCWLFL